MVKNRYIITGSRGFIGNFLTKKLHKNNNLICVDFKPEKYNRSYCESYHNIDLTQKKNVEVFFKKLIERKVLIDGLISCHGLTTEGSKKINSENIFQEYFNTNLFSIYEIFKHFVKLRSNKKIKKVITFSSIYGTRAPRHSLYINEKFSLHPGYMASKFALKGLNDWYASKFAKKNFAFNLISPGGVEFKHSKSFIKKYKKMVPSQKFTNLDEIYETVNFLINQKNNNITGQNIHLDGGFTL